MLQTSEYYSQGYYAFHFLVTPNELEDLLQPYHLINTENDVPADYVESPISEYVELYRQLYEMLINGEKLNSDAADQFTDKMRIVPDLSAYRNEKYHSYGDREYKKISFYEPYPVFLPITWEFDLDDDQKIRLFTSICYSLMFKNFIGFGICLAKEIKYQTDGEFIPVSELEAYSEYTAIKNSVTKFTEPLSIMLYGRRIETDIYISEEVKKHINNFYFFKNNHITALL